MDYTFGLIQYRKGKSPDYSHGLLGSRALKRDPHNDEISQSLRPIACSLDPTECGPAFERMAVALREVLIYYERKLESDCYLKAYNSDHKIGVIKVAKEIFQGKPTTHLSFIIKISKIYVCALIQNRSFPGSSFTYLHTRFCSYSEDLTYVEQGQGK
jgi:hypothetical protein